MQVREGGSLPRTHSPGSCPARICPRPAERWEDVGRAQTLSSQQQLDMALKPQELFFGFSVPNCKWIFLLQLFTSSSTSVACELPSSGLVRWPHAIAEPPKSLDSIRLKRSRAPLPFPWELPFFPFLQCLNLYSVTLPLLRRAFHFTHKEQFSFRAAFGGLRLEICPRSIIFQRLCSSNLFPTLG